MKRLLIIPALGLAMASQAAILWDNTSIFNNTTFRSPQNAPALQIQNSNLSAMNLTSVAFQGNNTLSQNIKFFLADSAGNVLQSVTNSYAAGGPHSLFSANVNWTLNGSTTYFIGAIMETAEIDYDFVAPPPTTTQNGLVGLANGNFSGFTAPSFGGTAGAEMSWQLSGTAAPEPATMAALGLGAVALIRRRRNKKA